MIDELISNFKCLINGPYNYLIVCRKNFIGRICGSCGSCMAVYVVHAVRVWPCVY
jgi:hypothetical protein